MKPVVTRLYALLVLLALVGLVVWSGAEWYQSQQKALEAGRTTLRQAAGTLAEGTLQGRDLAPGPALARWLAADGRWKMVLLWSEDRGTEYYRGPRPLVSIDQTPPRWEPKLWSEVRISLPVFRADGRTQTLEAIYEFYGRNEIFSLLKACGITLVILLVLTTLLVIWSSRRTEDPIEADRDGPVEPPTPPANRPVVSKTEDLDADDEYWFDDELDLDDLPPLDALPPLDDLPNFDAEPLAEEPFSDRLANELDRAQGLGSDLAVLVVASKKGADVASWGAELRSAFPVADVDLEHPTGAVVVLAGQSLEQALQEARRFVQQTDAARGGIGVHVGAAARSGRTVLSTTLLAEAESALRRSLLGDVRVLGLKSDPERFRQHQASA